MLKLIPDNLYRTSTDYIPQNGNNIYWHAADLISKQDSNTLNS